MRVDLTDDPAVVSMAAKLDVEEDAIVGKLHRLWSWADRHTIDGNVKGITPAWVDRFVGTIGFASAMNLAGWLDVTEGGVAFANFERHNGESAKKRAEEQRRKRLYRQAIEMGLVSQNRPKNVPHSVPEMSRTLSHKNADKNGTRERGEREERREEEPSNEGSKNTPIAPKGASVVSEAFERFWIAYPSGRKTGKGNALAAFTKAAKLTDVETIIAAATDYAASPLGKSEFVKGPAPWLNGRCWEDDRQAWNRSQGPPPPPPVAPSGRDVWEQVAAARGGSA